MPYISCPVCDVVKWWTDFRHKACGKCTRLIREANSSSRCCGAHRRMKVEMSGGIITSRCVACLKRDRLIIGRPARPDDD